MALYVHVPVATWVLPLPACWTVPTAAPWLSVLCVPGLCLRACTCVPTLCARVGWVGPVFTCLWLPPWGAVSQFPSEFLCQARPVSC